MILTRSPFYFNVPFTSSFITKVYFSLTVGTGFLNSITPRETYNFTKNRPSATAGNTWLDISPYIRDIYEFSPVSTNGITVNTISNSTTFSVLYASITAQPVDSLGSSLSPLSQKYICTDGYSYYSQGQNLQPTQKILLSHATYKADARGYFIVPLRATSGDSDPTVNGVSVALGSVVVNTNMVKYLIVPCFNYTGSIAVSYEGETINIELITECKFPLREIQFLNRFGAFEIMHFYKAAKESITVRSEDFKNAYTNGLSYDVQRHQIQRYNVQSNKSINIETGFLNPNYNFTIEELLQSEKVYLNGTPINVDTTSLDYKTRIVDKLISYNINFSQAFDHINNV